MSELLSIIIPAYNSSKYIHKMIKSVCEQTYENLEIIIIDDGSTDNTLDICKNYSTKDSRIVVFHKENEGVTKARDFGISKANGQYIAFVDSDDSIDPEMYETLYRNLKKFDADISHCGHKVIYSDNKIEYHYNTKEVKLQDNEEGLIDLITGDKVEPGLCTKLYKRHLFDNLKYDKTMKINEDYVINLCVFSKAKKSVYQDVPMYNYYMHDSSASHQLTKAYFYYDIQKAANFTKSMFANNMNIYPYAERRWFRILSTMYRNQLRVKYEDFDYKSFFADIRKQIKTESKLLKKNVLFSKRDHFILYMILFSPKLLTFVFKYR